MFTRNALTVLESRYLKKDDNGNILETPDDLLRRVARHVASAENSFSHNISPLMWEERFYDLMHNRYFLPNSPVLMNAGTGQGQMCACFVLPIENDKTQIDKIVRYTEKIHFSGGGTGFNFSNVYSEDDLDLHPLAVMERFNSLTERVKQSGRRRGANMGILNDDHPNIFEFVDCKNDDRSFRNFNISVGVSDEFMTAVINDDQWHLRHPQTRDSVKEIRARDLWNKIIDSAWRTGDPGMIFLDSVNKFNPVPGLGKIQTTNPCGEVPLQAFEPCVLGSLNLSLMLKETHGKLLPDYDLIADSIDVAVRFLDNVIEINDFIVTEIKNAAHGNRKIGLGVMGWAEMLIKMDVAYTSDKALSIAEELMQFISEEADGASRRLAGERGNFPNYSKSIFAAKGTPRRNATVLSIAPTGTISIIAGTSASIEPLYALSVTRRNILSGREMHEVNPTVLDYLIHHHFHNEDVLHDIRKQGVLAEDAANAHIRAVLKTANEIDFNCHIAHQSVFQKYTDNAVSKTINLPANATRTDIEKAYFIAWERNCKGITVYRDGSKSKQVLYKGTEILEANVCEVCVE